ncbi:MAG: hypothetical protein KIG72_07735 [Bradymonadales bacterium]|nr:hypothetical protein [Bradymonadales bacterium]
MRQRRRSKTRRFTDKSLFTQDSSIRSHHIPTVHPPQPSPSPNADTPCQRSGQYLIKRVDD